MVLLFGQLRVEGHATVVLPERVSYSAKVDVECSVDHIFRQLHEHRVSALQLLLSHVSWQILVDIVRVDKGTVDKWDRFQNILQRLGEIVRVFQRHVLIKNDVHFAKQFITVVVCLKSLHLLDGLGEAHGEVEEDIPLLCRCSLSAEILYMTRSRGSPTRDYIHREQNTPNGIKPPKLRIRSHSLVLATSNR